MSFQTQDQRNTKQSEIEEIARLTGANVKGFMPSKCVVTTEGKWSPQTIANPCGAGRGPASRN